MHASAKHGGGERAGHCGHDEGPLWCIKCAERLPEMCGNPPSFEHVALL